MKVIGITGTNGKTSTSFMVNAILEKYGFKTGIIGTVMVKYGNYIEPSILTTPESLRSSALFFTDEKAKYIPCSNGSFIFCLRA